MAEDPNDWASGEMNRDGIRFDGVYRTTTPIPLNSAQYGETFSLSLRFRPGSAVDCEYCFDEASEFEEQGASTTTFESSGGSTIRFSFVAEWWETEWEGTPGGERLRLRYLMEVVGPGPAAVRKCVVEGEAVLLFAPAAG
jgi:hypothetical protein